MRSRSTSPATSTALPPTVASIARVPGQQSHRCRGRVKQTDAIGCRRRGEDRLRSQPSILGVHHEIKRPLVAEDQRPAVQRPPTSPTMIARRPTAATSASAATRSKRSRLRCLTRSAGSRASCPWIRAVHEPSSAVASPSVRSNSHAATTSCTQEWYPQREATAFRAALVLQETADLQAFHVNGPCRNRTCNLGLKRPLLCRLS
jgi:hypothetical protein